MTQQRTLIDDLAHVRSGDKGDTLILGVLAKGPEDFELLRERLDAADIAAHYSMDERSVTRQVLPATRALIFRLTGRLGGGVTGSTHLDGHGKSLSYHLLSLELPSR
ncbi:MAG TPA: hypothetical protein H9871_12525 [Candidatus Nesterenkonia stercoripullorum]|uniref:AtuA-like ferredoxin-fold domain-containing protein n=1 Tax=Candidatus Nesterenkonia stercoripullorum TaxID=2838701 RepID=A0A9D2A8S1_9MICC|nr:hypothetical protein [Candidatus Nesterenkonia stercoripullorum]